MAMDTTIQPSLVEQILNEMFKTLEGRGEFDSHTIQKLKALAASDNLGKAKKVEEAIKSTPEGTS
jgi:hypothetical protein